MPRGNAKTGKTTKTRSAKTKAPSTAPVHAARAQRGRRGGLKDLSDMPLDILLEIFIHLTPQDLLNLARTSKAFRAFLMRRKSAHLWKAARRNVEDLPDCPSFLSEPAYANLVFCNHCHNCLKNNVKTVLWEFSARYCGPCKKVMLTKSIELPSSLEDALEESGMDEYYSKVLPVFFDRSTAYYHVRQVDKLCRAWWSLESDSRSFWHFLRKQRTKVKEIKEHAYQCRAWSEHMTLLRSAALDEIRADRREGIIARLSDSGWEKEIEQIKEWDKFKNHPLVRVPKYLTEREWTKISAAMIATMEGWKEDLVEFNRRELLRSRMRIHSEFIEAFYAETPRTADTECMPHPVDFALMPLFRQVITAPSDTEVTLETFFSMRGQLPGLMHNWRVEIEARLQQMMVGRFPLPVPDLVNSLGLALAYFKCKNCSKVLHYPNLLAHECFRRRRLLIMDKEDVYGKLIVEAYDDSPWDAGQIVVAPFIRQFTRITEACGQEANLVSAADMDALDTRLCCSFPNAPQARFFVSWRVAVLIEYAQKRLYRYERPVTWRLASEEEESEIAELEARAHLDVIEAFETQPRWCCALCKSPDAYCQTLAATHAHLDVSHGIPHENITNVHFYLHPDGVSPRPEGVVLLPENPITDSGDEDEMWDAYPAQYFPTPSQDELEHFLEALFVRMVD